MSFIFDADYQKALSLSSLVALFFSIVRYSLMPSRFLNIPSGANNAGALVVGRSTQQFSSNFLIWYSTNLTLLFSRSSLASREFSVSSINRTGLRITTTPISIWMYLISIIIWCVAIMVWLIRPKAQWLQKLETGNILFYFIY